MTVCSFPSAWPNRLPFAKFFDSTWLLQFELNTERRGFLLVDRSVTALGQERVQQPPLHDLLVGPLGDDIGTRPYDPMKIGYSFRIEHKKP